MNDVHSSAAVIHFTSNDGRVDALVGPFRTLGDATVAADAQRPVGATHAAVLPLFNTDGSWISWITIYSATDMNRRMSELCGGWPLPATDEEMCWVVDLEFPDSRGVVGPFAGKAEAQSYADNWHAATDGRADLGSACMTLRPLVDIDLTPQDAMLAKHVNSFGHLYDMTVSAIADAS